jgi:hypothetical protein
MVTWRTFLRLVKRVFFFVGHKTGRGSLEQINRNAPLVDNSKKFDLRSLSDSKPIISNKVKGEIVNEKKPLQHVNISDLLSAHKKGGTDA